MSDPFSDPAFPTLEEHTDDGVLHYEGMSLRDYFAGQALAGQLVTSPEALSGASDHMGMARPEMIAVLAYNIADAMLAVRKEARDE